jgi:hypothetical protein
MDSSDDSKKGFFKHVFNFDDDSKNEILNTFQYILLAIIPVIILNKAIGKFVPEADDKKNSVEIVAEILIQIIVIFMGLLLIHRIITYIPTYSNTKYPDFHIIFIVLSILLIIMSLQTKLGEKVNILVERITELWNGHNTKATTDKNKGTVKVSQPISGQTQIGPITGQPSYTEGTAISSLPTYDQTSATQQLPNYNNMYRQDTTPLVGAASPGGGAEGFGEPMAANSVLGGSFGSAW